MNRTSTAPRYTRRKFLARGALYGGTLWVSLNAPRPLTLQAAEASTEPVSLSEDQWRTVEAITGRIIPTDHEPGAIEANCVNFIDKALAHEDSNLMPTYETGLAGIDSVSESLFGKSFTDLSPEQQVAILTSLESGQADGWSDGAVDPATFFDTVRVHTITGFLADPRYGGNRDYAGWKVLGYPGPRHTQAGFTPQQMQGEAPIIAIWGEEV